MLVDRRLFLVATCQQSIVTSFCYRNRVGTFPSIVHTSQHMLVEELVAAKSLHDLAFHPGVIFF